MSDAASATSPPLSPRKPRRQGGVLDLIDYAPLGDGRSVAVSGIDGSIDWWGVDGIDSPPLFDRLLGGAGHFSVRPAGAFHITRRYRPDSNVLETVFITKRGRARMTESLNSGLAGRLPWSELARRFDGLEGELRFELRLRCETHSKERYRMTRDEGGISVASAHLNLSLLAQPQVVLQIRDSTVVGHFDITANERVVTALVANRRAPVAITPLAAIDGRIDESDSQWRRWANKLTYDGLYTSEVRRSALALKLLLYSPSGAIAAAATSSLPERVGGDKNWDYRFAWTRDVAYSIKALLRVGAYEEAQAAISWLLDRLREHEGRPHVFYRLDGSNGTRARASTLPGYRASRPVRSGNDALGQEQLGMYGDLLIAARDFVDKGHHLDPQAAQLLAGIADTAARRWRRKDSGLWELAQRQHYTLSKISCWAALDVAVALAERGLLPGRNKAVWSKARRDIHRWVEENCFSAERNAYVMHPGSRALDAALLLAAPFGYPELTRLNSTREALQAELGRGALLYRYSGVEAEEQCFLACTFWCVETLACCGHVVAARELMDEAVRIAASDQGIYHEMVDPRTRQMLGNFPQGLSHLAMIHAAEAVTRGFRRPT